MDVKIILSHGKNEALSKTYHSTDNWPASTTAMWMTLNFVFRKTLRFIFGFTRNIFSSFAMQVKHDRPSVITPGRRLVAATQMVALPSGLNS